VRALRPDGVDGAVDAALLGERAAALVRDGGAFVSLRRTHAIEDPRLRHRYISVMDAMEDAAALAWLAERLGDGSLAPRVTVRLPMSAAAEAHRLVEQGGSSVAASS
jgi:NADPH2:quinone reductase